MISKELFPFRMLYSTQKIDKKYKWTETTEIKSVKLCTKQKQFLMKKNYQ